MPNKIPSPNAQWERNVRNGLTLFSSSPRVGIELAFFTRAGGFSRAPFDGLNLSPDVGDDAEDVRRNRAAIMQALGITSLATVRQVHSSEVVYVDERTRPDTVQADGLFTDRPGVALGVKVADCLPIYFVGTRDPVIGLAHAGWRGTRDRIAARLVEAIHERFGTEPKDLSYALGPCIAPACYEVGPEVARAFAGFPNPAEFLRQSIAEGKVLLDLKAANRQILQGLGLTELASLDLCPHCLPEQFYSARRDRITGRNLAVIVRR
jgi:hypothetical protein